MNNLKRFFNQNRKLIFKTCFIIFACFIGLRLVNHFVKIQNEQTIKENNSNSVDRIDNRDYEIISGQRKDEDEYYLQSKLIEEFLQYCNNKDFEKAYDLISQECKDIMFQDINIFINDYAKKFFENRKNYQIQAWNLNTYKVKIIEDPLITGKTNDENYIENFITINSGKLNINNYLYTLNMNKKLTKAEVTLKVEQINVFMDYSIVKLNILNEREKKIMLNSMEYADNVYLMDDNDSKYIALLHELFQDEFIIEPRQNKDIYIKFDIPYSRASHIKSLNINNIISDYEQYNELGDKIILYL